MLIVLAIGIFLAIFLGVFIARIIGKPINALASAADKLALGDVNVNIEATTTDEIGDLMRSFEKMVDNIKENAGAAAGIAKGDFTVEVEAKSSNDVLSKSMQQVVESLKKMVVEAQMLTRDAVEVKLDTRGNGRQIHRRIPGNRAGGEPDPRCGNRAVEAWRRSMWTASPRATSLRKTTDNYNGDFNEIKNNLNRCIDAVNLLVADANLLVKAAAARDNAQTGKRTYA